MRDARERAVAELVGLPRERGDEARVIVPERRDPPRGVGVEVAPPVDVEEARALGARDDERLGVARCTRPSACTGARRAACRRRRWRRDPCASDLRAAACAGTRAGAWSRG